MDSKTELIQTVTDASALIDHAIAQAADVQPAASNCTRMRLAGAKRLCERALGHLDEPSPIAAAPDVAHDIDAEMGNYVPPPHRKGLAWMKRWFGMGER